MQARARHITARYCRFYSFRGDWRRGFVAVVQAAVPDVVRVALPTGFGCQHCAVHAGVAVSRVSRGDAWAAWPGQSAVGLTGAPDSARVRVVACASEVEGALGYVEDAVLKYVADFEDAPDLVAVPGWMYAVSRLYARCAIRARRLRGHACGCAGRRYGHAWRRCDWRQCGAVQSRGANDRW